MAWKEPVSRLDILSLNEYDLVCKGCVLRKSHRSLLSKVSKTIYLKMELVVIDIIGPISVRTWTGHAYTMVILKPVTDME